MVLLVAPPDLVAARIEEREPDSWPGKQALIDHARELAASMPALRGVHHTIETTGRLAVDVAAEIRDLLFAEGR